MASSSTCSCTGLRYARCQVALSNTAAPIRWHNRSRNSHIESTTATIIKAAVAAAVAP